MLGSVAIDVLKVWGGDVDMPVRVNSRSMFQRRYVTINSRVCSSGDVRRSIRWYIPA